MVQPSSCNATDLFLIHTTTTTSTQHSVFAETLRDWRDPLLQGHEPNPVRVCPRCTSCRCQSLTNLSSSSAHAGHNHEPSCPRFRHHLRATSSMKQRFAIRSQRRAVSSVPAMQTSLHVQLSAAASCVKRVNSSRIPVRIFTTVTPVGKRTRDDVSQPTSKIPRLRVTCARSLALGRFDTAR